MIKIRTTFCISIFLLISALFSGIASAEDSLISVILSRRQSIVGIKGVQGGLMKSPQPSAVIDKSSGRMLISRGVRAAYYSKSGAGIIITSSGYIVTNLHIIMGAKNIIVELYDSSSYPAEVALAYPQHDLAIIKIKASIELHPIPLADSNKAQLGEQVINIGHSPYLKETLSAGKIISLAKSRLTGEVEIIKVNINLYKGDSGGPLFNRSGELIGIVSAQLKSQDRSTLAIPSNKIVNLASDLIK
ncbi:MAG: trypsin-like peptidase domain-containing protein [Candidatus Omnitrophica bacterium]|nr:trypsin-like peptidase domain-containing protein [Candidatus Omnitrophota bacterium]